MKQTESEITKSIRSALGVIGCYCWKQWQGPMSQPRGVSDIIGVWNGKFVAIEVKKPGGKLSPAQEAFILRVRRHGGIAFVAYSVDDVIAGLGVKDRFLF